MASARRHAFVVTACVFLLVVNTEALNTLAPSLRQASEALKANEWPSLLQVCPAQSCRSAPRKRRLHLLPVPSLSRRRPKTRCGRR
jgi:hypothetical protein